MKIQQKSCKNNRISRNIKRISGFYLDYIDVRQQPYFAAALCLFRGLIPVKALYINYSSRFAHNYPTAIAWAGMLLLQVCYYYLLCKSNLNNDEQQCRKDADQQRFRLHRQTA